MSHNADRVIWDSDDSQFCDGCGAYHYRNECTDAYFNDSANWAPRKGIVRASASSATARYRRRYA